VPEYTAEKIAALVGGKLIGDGSRVVRGVADLRNARKDHVSFLSNPRYLALARKTAAGVVILGLEDPSDFSFTQIRAAKPSIAFNKIVSLFVPEPIRHERGVHATAVVAADAQLEADVSIQAHAVIEPGVRIGARSVIGAGCYVGHGTVVGSDCLLYPHVCLRERTVLGSRVILHCGAVIGADGFGYQPQDKKHIKIPQLGYVQIDDDVEIGANTTIDRGRFDRTWIQEGVKIDNQVQIAHNVTVGRNSIIVAQAGISGSVTIGESVRIAGQAGTVGHIDIGDGATVVAQAGVTKDVPPGSVVAGRHTIPLRQNLKVEALTLRLPEILKRVEALEKKPKKGKKA
jgi:UDP-3-O-[3-hydroxymyristoyl] glucosamine N-acyltransferase